MPEQGKLTPNEEKIQSDRREFVRKEFANQTPEFTEYGKRFLAKKYHFMVIGDTIAYLPGDKIETMDVFRCENPQMQITITALLAEKHLFDPFGNEKLQLQCNLARFK